MFVEQISVFIENKNGRLSAISNVLAESGINISALSLAENEEYGMLRMVVDNPHKAKEVLKEHGVICKVSKVLCLEIEDVAGGFAKIVEKLSLNKIEIQYMYACLSRKEGKALMIFNVDDVELAEKILNS